MARPGIEKGQVVWAKLGGYPWWPGIVDSVQDDCESSRKVTVKFIGENTHATLSSSKVVDFAEFLLQHSKTKKKHLLRCIESAKRFANGDLDLSDLPSVNLSLDRQHRLPVSPPPPRKQPKVQAKSTRAELPVTWKPVTESFCASVKASSSAQPHDVKLPTDDPDKLIKPHSLPYLRQGVHNQVSLAQRTLVAFLREPQSPVAELSSVLLPLLHTDIPPSLLSLLSRQLKAFLSSVADSSKPVTTLVHKVLLALKDRQLTHTLEDLVDFLPPSVLPSKSAEVISVPSVPKIVKLPPPIHPKQPVEVPMPVSPCPLVEVIPIKDDDSTCSVELSVHDPQDISDTHDLVTFPESEEFVANRDKRRHVCLTVYRILQANGFTMKDAKVCALRIERRLRRQDPEMGDVYAVQYKKMVRDIQRLQPEALTCS